MRVVSLNLWGRRGDWPARQAVLVAGLRDLRPDLVAFHEAIATDGYDQVRDLLGPGFHVAHLIAREAGRGGDVEDGQGLSIASRWSGWSGSRSTFPSSRGSSSSERWATSMRWTASIWRSTRARPSAWWGRRAAGSPRSPAS